MTDRESDLYIFDFDETLVRYKCAAKIFDKTSGAFIKEMTIPFFIECYKLEENEEVEFVDIGEPLKLSFARILYDAATKFKEDIEKHVWICTARYNDRAPKKFLEETGLEFVPIAIVGVKQFAGNLEFNAEQKKKFVRKLAKKTKPKTIFFYDDSALNIEKIESLKKELDCRIILINSITNELRAAGD